MIGLIEEDEPMDNKQLGNSGLRVSQYACIGLSAILRNEWLRECWGYFKERTQLHD